MARHGRIARAAMRRSYFDPFAGFRSFRAKRGISSVMITRHLVEAFAWETKIGEQRKFDVHINESVAEADFVEIRRSHDSSLGMPTLMWPAIQVNVRAGHLPPPAGNWTIYLKLPVEESEDPA